MFGNELVLTEGTFSEKMCWNHKVYLNQEFHCALQATKNEESNSRIIPGGFPYAELSTFGCHELATLSPSKETFRKLRVMQLQDSNPFDLPALSELLQEV